MITIETIVKKNDSSEKQPISTYDGPYSDGEYLDGLIILKSDEGQSFVQETGDLEALWCYTVDSLLKFKNKGTAEIWFPDYPAELLLKSIGNKISLTLQIRTTVYEQIVIPIDDYFRAIKFAGKTFFKRISQIAPELSASTDLYIQRIERL